jgi:hypothetical protein
MVVVLSLTDIHLFMRGVGDLIFILLGIVTGRAVTEKAKNASGKRKLDEDSVR